MRDLTSLLDPGGGWYGVFRQRDPDGLRACFDGVEIPPWDVVESLLQDFGAGRDAEQTAAEAARARRLHAASAAAYDRRAGGGEALSERLRLMLREQAYAVERADELVRQLRTTPEGSPEGGQLAHDLAWVRDDHARASARCAELRSRLTALTTPGRGGPPPRPVAPEGWFRAEESPADEESVFGTRDPAPAGSGPRDNAHDNARVNAQGSARYAGGGTGAGTDGTGGAPSSWAGEPRAACAYGQAAPQGPYGNGNGPAHAPRDATWGPGAPLEGLGHGPASAGRGAGRGAGTAPAAGGSEAVRDSSPQWAGEAPRTAPRDQEPEPAPTRQKKRGSAAKRKPRGARFAGLDLDDDADEPVAAPLTDAPPPTARDTPRGARFGGALAGAARPAEPAHSPEDLRAAADLVASLVGLRAQGRSGEAHVLLCEAAGRPPGQLPLLAAELNRAGLGADWAELLWEAASLPPDRLAAAAGALAVAGRDDDCGQLLRQGAARPAEEIADAVLALGEAGRAHEAQALLSTFVQARTPEDAARIAVPDPRRLVPQLLDAARAVSAGHERDVVHALRVAGIGAA
ncbi:hypothetical protein [Streptomyces sp. NBC_01317]|uniref:hypothetical protein n=1 Tax=Streptomyces sp. NBC_01317 TaxID=2903822 RepID=UPI002E105403